MRFSIFLFSVFLSFKMFSQSFVSPIGFVDNESNRQKVIAYIKKQVKEDCAKIGMDDATTLRMMEKENLKAFKELVELSNKELLQRVITTYCEIGMCSYSTFLMMYNEESKASSEELKW